MGSKKEVQYSTCVRLNSRLDADLFYYVFFFPSYFRNKSSQPFRTTISKKRRRIRFDGDSDEEKAKKKTNRNSRVS